MTSRRPVEDNSGSGIDHPVRPWGIFYPSDETIQIDTRKHLDAYSSVNDSEDERTDTIIHERIHYDDWADNQVYDYSESQVASQTRSIINAIFQNITPGAACEIDWTRQQLIGI